MNDNIEWEDKVVQRMKMESWKREIRRDDGTRIQWEFLPLKNVVTQHLSFALRWVNCREKIPRFARLCEKMLLTNFGTGEIFYVDCSNPVFHSVSLLPGGGGILCEISIVLCRPVAAFRTVRGQRSAYIRLSQTEVVSYLDNCSYFWVMQNPHLWRNRWYSDPWMMFLPFIACFLLVQVSFLCR